MSFSTAYEMDVMDELRTEDRLARQLARRVCPECRHMGGSHATGCPGDYDDEQEESEE